MRPKWRLDIVTPLSGGRQCKVDFDFQRHTVQYRSRVNRVGKWKKKRKDLSKVEVDLAVYSRKTSQLEVKKLFIGQILRFWSKDRDSTPSSFRNSTLSLFANLVDPPAFARSYLSFPFPRRLPIRTEELEAVDLLTPIPPLPSLLLFLSHLLLFRHSPPPSSSSSDTTSSRSRSTFNFHQQLDY